MKGLFHKLARSTDQPVRVPGQGWLLTKRSSDSYLLAQGALVYTLRGEIPDPEALADEIWSTTLLLDKPGLFTTRDVSKNS